MTQKKGLSKLQWVLERLRDPQKGCPWDLEQTHESLMPYIHEEVAEFEEALFKFGPKSQETQSELGDLFFQIVFHTQLLKEQNISSLDKIAEKTADKLISRHQHVFLSTQEELSQLSSDDVRILWEQQKLKEKSSESRKAETPAEKIKNIPSKLDPLLRSQRIGDKAAGYNFDWPTAQEAFLKVEEELGELKAAQNESHAQSEFGDLLFALCQYARKKGWNSRHLLMQANDKFCKRFERTQDIMFQKQKAEVKDWSLESLDQAWEEAKKEE